MLICNLRHTSRSFIRMDFSIYYVYRFNVISANLFETPAKSKICFTTCRLHFQFFRQNFFVHKFKMKHKVVNGNAELYALYTNTFFKIKCIQVKFLGHIKYALVGYLLCCTMHTYLPQTICLHIIW